MLSNCDFVTANSGIFEFRFLILNVFKKNILLDGFTVVVAGNLIGYELMYTFCVLSFPQARECRLLGLRTAKCPVGSALIVCTQSGSGDSDHFRRACRADCDVLS